MDSYKTIAYNALKNKILTCQLRPNDVIDQNEVMKELGVSRTPVREAIAVLEQENLVTILPRRGVLVSNISLSGIANIYATREVIEPYIAGLVTNTADPKRLREFLKIFSGARDYAAETKADYDFHKYLVQLSGNRYLIQVMDQVLSHNMRFIILGAGLPDRLNNSSVEHSQIIHAMLERDAQKAEQLMREHLKFARQSAYDSMPTVGM